MPNHAHLFVTPATEKGIPRVIHMRAMGREIEHHKKDRPKKPRRQSAQHESGSYGSTQ